MVTPKTISAMPADFSAADEQWETAAQFLHDEFATGVLIPPARGKNWQLVRLRSKIAQLGRVRTDVTHLLCR
jgi:hypothetical protein